MSAPAEQYDPVTGEVLDSDAPGNGGWDRERHCITDLRGADWAGRKLREAQEQIALNAAMAEAELEVLARKVRLLRECQEKADEPFAASVAYFRNALTVYASTPEGKAEVLKGLRKKSRLLPSGVTVAYRTSRDQIEVTNADALFVWAHDRDDNTADLLFPAPEPLTAAELLSKKSLNALMSKPDAPVPDGVKRTPGVESVQVLTELSEEESK